MKSLLLGYLSWCLKQPGDTYCLEKYISNMVAYFCQVAKSNDFNIIWINVDGVGVINDFFMLIFWYVLLLICIPPVDFSIKFFTFLEKKSLTKHGCCQAN